MSQSIEPTTQNGVPRTPGPIRQAKKNTMIQKSKPAYSTMIPAVFTNNVGEEEARARRWHEQELRNSRKTWFGMVFGWFGYVPDGVQVDVTRRLGQPIHRPGWKSWFQKTLGLSTQQPSEEEEPKSLMHPDYAPHVRGHTPLPLREKKRQQQESQWAQEVGSDVQTLGESLQAMPSTRVDSNVGIFVSSDDEQEDEPSSPISSTAHPPHSKTMKFDVSARIDTRPSKSQDDWATALTKTPGKKPVINKRPDMEEADEKDNIGVAAPTPARNSLAFTHKDHFHRHFKSDSSHDEEYLSFIQEYTGWEPRHIRAAFKHNRFPKLGRDLSYDISKMKKLARIFSDRGFLIRNNFHAEVKFEPLYGVRGRDLKNANKLPVVYIAETELEPKPSRSVREFSEEERKHMQNTRDFRPLRAEWASQTIYDLVFRTPSDEPIAAGKKELADERFEVDRNDPRFRHMVDLLPALHTNAPLSKFQERNKHRLEYKREVSRRDYWFWDFINIIRKRDRTLGLVFDHFDLNRKRAEMFWDEYRKVKVVRGEPQPEVEAAKAVAPKSTTKRVLTPHPAKTVDLLAARKPLQPISAAWEPQVYADSDSDRDETASPTLVNLTISRQYLPNAGGKSRDASGNQIVFDPKANAGPKTRQKKKKVSFLPGHVLTIYRRIGETPSPSAVPSELRRAAKKLKASEDVSVPSLIDDRSDIFKRKDVVQVQNMTNDSSNTAPPLTRPVMLGNNPLKRRYAHSFIDIPREWRHRPGTFSAWEEDFEDSGVFYELDIKDGKLPRGVGTWESEIERTRGPKRVRVMKSDGTDQDYIVRDLSGKLLPLDAINDTDSPKNGMEAQKAAAEAFKAAGEQPPAKAPVFENKENVPEEPKEPTTGVSFSADPFLSYAAESSAKEDRDRQRRALEKEIEKYQESQAQGRRLQRDAEERLRQIRDAIRAESGEESLIPVESDDKDDAYFDYDMQFDGAGNPKPRSKRRPSKETKEPKEMKERKFPVFDPFESIQRKPSLVRTSSKSEGSLPSPPLSNEDDNSGKEDSGPGSKAKARLTGLFDPIAVGESAKSQTAFEPAQKAEASIFSSEPANKSKVSPFDLLKSPGKPKTEAPAFKPFVFGQPANNASTPFTIVEDSKVQEESKKAPDNIFGSFQSEATAPSSAGSENQENQENQENVLKPVSNDARLQRQNSTDVPKTQSLLPPAPITSTTTATPSAAITAAEMGMFGAVKPSPNEKRGLEDDFGMDIDNTPQSAKRIRSPKSFGNVTEAASSMSESFKPTVPASFDFGSMNSKPLFGGENTIVANASTPSAGGFVFGASAKPAEEPFKFGAGTPTPANNTSAPFQFGASTTSNAAAPSIFGTSVAEKPADAPFVFGGKATATPVSSNLFGTSTAAPAAPSIFGASTAATSAPSLFGTSTSGAAAPSIFGVSTAAPAAPSIFGASTAAPAAPSLFGASSAAPASNGLFGAVSGVSAAPLFGATTASAPQFSAQAPATAPTSFNFGANTSSAPSFGANTSSAPSFGGNATSNPTSSASFTFGSTATTQPMQFGGELTKPTAASFTSGFNFGSGANSPAPGGNFNFGATSSAPSPAPSGPTFGASPAPTPAGASFGGDAANPFGFQPQTGTMGRNIKAPVSRKAGSMRRR